MGHGSKHKRLAGGLAAGTYPSRVFKGNDGPGRMGRETVTVQNIELVKVIPERNVLLVKGSASRKQRRTPQNQLCRKRTGPVRTFGRRNE